MRAATEGAKVVVGVRRSGTGSATFDKITKAGGKGHEIVLDIGDTALIEKGVRAAHELHGRPGILICNAAVDHAPILVADMNWGST